MNELNIYQKLMQVRVEILNASIKKTGYNKFSNFYYYELKDFLRTTINSFYEIKLYSRFSIIPATPTSEEMATLIIINSEKIDEVEVYTIPTAECFIGRKKDGTGGADPIQNLGGKITYLRRYLYLIALDLIEDDSVDGKEQIGKKKESQNEKHETKSFGNVTEKEATDLARKKGLGDLLKSLEKKENIEYKVAVMKTICEELKVDKWYDIQFTKTLSYNDLIIKVMETLKKEKDLAKAGI